MSLFHPFFKCVDINLGWIPSALIEHLDRRPKCHCFEDVYFKFIWFILILKNNPKNNLQASISNLLKFNSLWEREKKQDRHLEDGSWGRGGIILLVWYPILKLPPQSHLSLERLSSGRRMALDSGAEVASQGSTHFNWMLNMCERGAVPGAQRVGGRCSPHPGTGTAPRVRSPWSCLPQC